MMLTWSDNVYVWTCHYGIDQMISGKLIFSIIFEGLCGILGMLSFTIFD